MKPQPNYFFSPTLLDTFSRFLDADSIWEKYYGDMEEGSEKYISLPDFQDQCFKELLDRLNGVRVSSPDMAKGTIFNDIVDTLVHNRCMGRTTMRRLYFDANGNVSETPNGNVVGIRGILPDVDQTYQFDFEIGFCRMAAEYFKNCVAQLRVDADIETCMGVVHFLGYIDELREDVVYDIKTCKKYEYGKYATYNQRYVYPYCLIESGMVTGIKEFEFTAFNLYDPTRNRPMITGALNREVYTYDHETAQEELRNICELFINFIEINRDKITNQRIFTMH